MASGDVFRLAASDVAGVLRGPVAACTALILCCVTAACGSGDDAGTDQTAARAAPVRSISPKVAHTGARKCQSLTPRQALARFSKLARRSSVSDAAAVRKGLLQQVTTMPKAARTGPVAARMAAGLYAVTVEPARRPAAFQGCLAALTEASKR